MAVGDRNETRLFGPATLGSSSAGLGSGVVPSGQSWIIKQMVICNTGGTERLVYLGIGDVATASNRFFSALPVAAYDTIVWDTSVVLTAGERIWGYSDSASQVSVMAMGWVKEV